MVGRTALGGLEGRAPLGVFAFDCIARKGVLGDEGIVAEVERISGGRAEIVAGRGSFIESFPLFGLKLEDYDDLFAEFLPEKLDW